MAKQIRGNARRMPPEPTGHAEIEAWFGRVMPHHQPVVRQLDESIRDAVLDLEYAVKYKRAFYGVPGLGWIIEVAPYDVSVNVMFLGGADFDPAPELGSVDRTRYVKITSVAEATQPGLFEWIGRAGLTPGWR